ncbi:MAG: sulfotransferase family protein [Micavibrio sp.]|nr:sulfotransferase family protein [Micavibrio sp.]
MKKIVFHHIPKCAGMSLTAGLAMSFHPLYLLRYGKKGFSGRLNAKAAHETADAKNLNDYAFRRNLLFYQLSNDDSPMISGHYPFCPEVYNRFRDECDFITVLRDPVARWYSEYFWNKYKDHDYKKTDLDLEAYIETDQAKKDAFLYVNFLTPREDENAKPNTEDVNKAFENLSKFTVVGDVSDTSRFKSCVKKKFGRPLFIPKRNSSPAPKGSRNFPDKESDIQKRLLNLLEADIELYERAKGLM